MSYYPPIKLAENNPDADLRSVYKRLENTAYVAYHAVIEEGRVTKILYWVETHMFPKGWF